MQPLYLISPKFGDFIGGMETHSYEFARHFKQCEEFPLHSVYMRNGVTDGIIVGDAATHNGHSWPHPAMKLLTGDFEHDASAIIEHTKNIPGIYFLNSPTWAPIAPHIKRQQPRSRIVVRSGGNDIVAGWMGDEHDPSHFIEETRKQLAAVINNHVDKFIVNSNFSYNRTLETGVSKDLLALVSGGVDCNKFIPGNYEGPLTILGVGRLVNFKGFEYCIRAVENTQAATGVPLRYVIVGDGPERQKLERLATESPVEITIVGAKSIEQIPEYFKNADIFIHLPIHEERVERGSKYIHTETMGRSLCEASAAGLPIVASAVGGVSEVVDHGKTGFLIEEKNVMAATEGIIDLIHSKELRLAMGKAGREKAMHEFDWSIVFRRYYDLFA